MTRRRKVVMTEEQLGALLKLAGSGLLTPEELITVARALSTNGIGIPGVIPGTVPAAAPPVHVNADEVPPWGLPPPTAPAHEAAPERTTAPVRTRRGTRP